MSGLRYTGGGTGGFLPDVPARDLSSEEIQERGLDAAALLASGLYEPVVLLPRGKSEKHDKDGD